MHPDRESDAALVARFARLRDEGAFAELVRRHGPMVLGVAMLALKNRQDAEDALQAVFLTMSAKARALRRVRSLAGWVHNVALRISLNLHKMNRRREQGLRQLHQERGRRLWCSFALDSTRRPRSSRLFWTTLKTAASRTVRPLDGSQVYAGKRHKPSHRR